MCKCLITGILILLFSAGLFSQERYSVSSFDEINRETYSYATKNGENLKLDIYLPGNDSDYERATIIYVHGGGFSSDQRDSEKIQQL